MILGDMIAVFFSILLSFDAIMGKSIKTNDDTKAVKKTLQEESTMATRISSVPSILREAVDSGWLNNAAVNKIQNRESHKVEGYFMNSDTSISEDGPQFGSKALQLHNIFRLIHHSQPLHWSNTLETAAKTIALRLAEQNAAMRDEIPGLNQSALGFRVLGAVLQDSDDKYGENVICIPDVPYHCDYGVQEATRRWYNQGQNYSFSSPEVATDTASFTQLIWKNSRQLGMGCAEKKGLLTHDLYIVALYNPAGNTVGAVRDNVLRPGKTGDVYNDIY